MSRNVVGWRPSELHDVQSLIISSACTLGDLDINLKDLNLHLKCSSTSSAILIQQEKLIFKILIYRDDFRARIRIGILNDEMFICQNRKSFLRALALI